MLDRDQGMFSRDVIRQLTEQPIDYIDMSFLFELIVKCFPKLLLMLLMSQLMRSTVALEHLVKQK